MCRHTVKMAASNAHEFDVRSILQKIPEFAQYLRTKTIFSSVASETNSSAISQVDKREILTKVISSLIGLTLSFGVSYFVFQWLGTMLDPTNKEKKEAKLRAEKLMKIIGVTGVQLSADELCIASNLVDPLSMSQSWSDIGGLDDVIQEIKESVILPFKNYKLFAKSGLLKAPKGVLLYGPPGCGKTMIAKAIAKDAGARFINLQVSTLMDKWYGESQKRVAAVFSLAVKLQPVIIFIDELDSFLRSRSSTDHEATAMMKTQFMSFWDGLITDSDSQIMIVGATNRPQDVDAAILRRMPCMFHIGLPESLQRKQLLHLILDGEEVSSCVDIGALVSKTEGFSGSDLVEMCRSAAVCTIRDYMKEQESDDGVVKGESELSEEVKLRKITMEDMEEALEKMRKTNHGSSRLPFASQVPLD